MFMFSQMPFVPYKHKRPKTQKNTIKIENLNKLQNTWTVKETLRCLLFTLIF